VKFCGDPPYLGLVISTQGEEDLAELVFGQAIEEIALVLGFVQALEQQGTAGAFVLVDARVVAGCQTAESRLPSPFDSNRA
jgi:hypothetical protein